MCEVCDFSADHQFCGDPSNRDCTILGSKISALQIEWDGTSGNSNFLRPHKHLNRSQYTCLPI